MPKSSAPVSNTATGEFLIVSPVRRTSSATTAGRWWKAAANERSASWQLRHVPQRSKRTEVVGAQLALARIYWMSP